MLRFESQARAPRPRCPRSRGPAPDEAAGGWARSMNRGHRHGASSGCLGTMEVKSKVRGRAGRQGRGMVGWSTRGCPVRTQGGGMVEGELLAEARRRETWWSAAMGGVCVCSAAQSLFSILHIPALLLG